VRPPDGKQHEPTRVGSADDWTAVALGTHHACGLRVGTMYCWGAATNGVLGVATPSVGYVDEPVALPASGWTTLALGGEHSCAVRDDQLYCFGDNQLGQLGVDGEQRVPERPTELPAP
jgi:alpha-tubulin suppressor-like RCC1 family protein